MKRLTYVTGQPWSASGAPSIHVDRVCSGLSLLGWEVEVIQPGPGAVTTAKPYSSVSINVPAFCRVVTFQLLVVPVLIRTFLRKRPAVLYIRQETCLILPVIVASVFRVPIVLEVNGHLLLESVQRGHKLDRLLIRFGMLQFIEAVNVKHAEAIVAVAPGIREYLRSRYPWAETRISVIPNGVDRTVVPITCIQASGSFCVGYVGALESWQGLAYVVEAASLIKARIPNISFLFVGDGKEKSSLMALAQALQVQDKVMFVGAVPHSQIAEYLSRMDLCINYPVRARGGLASPMKIYEYLVAQRPVLSADVVGLREEFGTSAAYVDAENASALAASIEYFATDEVAFMSLQSAAVNASKSIRSWDDVADDVALICERIASFQLPLPLRPVKVQHSGTGPLPLTSWTYVCFG